MKRTTIIALISAALLTGCASTKYVPVPEVHEYHHNHTDTVHVTDSIVRESNTTIMQLDSAAMARYGIRLQHAEKAWLVKTSELQLMLNRMEHMGSDTVIIHDRIPVPVPVQVKEKVAKVSLWQKITDWMVQFIGILIGVLLIYILLYYFFRKS